MGEPEPEPGANGESMQRGEPHDYRVAWGWSYTSSPTSPNCLTLTTGSASADTSVINKVESPSKPMCARGMPGTRLSRSVWAPMTDGIRLGGPAMKLAVTSRQPDCKCHVLQDRVEHTDPQSDACRGPVSPGM